MHSFRLPTAHAHRPRKHRPPPGVALQPGTRQPRSASSLPQHSSCGHGRWISAKCQRRHTLANCQPHNPVRRLWAHCQHVTTVIVHHCSTFHCKASCRGRVQCKHAQSWRACRGRHRLVPHKQHAPSLARAIHCLLGATTGNAAGQSSRPCCSATCALPSTPAGGSGLASCRRFLARGRACQMAGAARRLAGKGGPSALLLSRALACLSTHLSYCDHIRLATGKHAACPPGPAPPPTAATQPSPAAAGVCPAAGLPHLPARRGSQPGACRGRPHRRCASRGSARAGVRAHEHSALGVSTAAAQCPWLQCLTIRPIACISQSTCPCH